MSTISGKTRKIVANIEVGNFPAEVRANQRTNTVCVTVGNTVSVINGQTNAVVATVPVGKCPQGVAANPKTDTVYVSNNCDNTVSVLTSSQG